MHKQWSLVIGRFQCIPPHKGHLAVINQLLKEGKNVLITLREEDGTEKNPYSLFERRHAFEKIYHSYINAGIVKITEEVDIIEVCYGRTPGWGIREVIVPKELQKISATEIRKQKK